MSLMKCPQNVCFMFMSNNKKSVQLGGLSRNIYKVSYTKRVSVQKRLCAKSSDRYQYPFEGFFHLQIIVVPVPVSVYLFVEGQVLLCGKESLRLVLGHVEHMYIPSRPLLGLNTMQPTLLWDHSCHGSRYTCTVNRISKATANS